MVRSFEVAEVFPGSVADAAGVLPGLRYVLNSKRANDQTYIKEKLEEGEVRSRFVDDRTKTEIELVTLGYPFGMALRRPLDALCSDLKRSFNWTSQHLDELIDRVHEGDDQVFEHLVKEMEGPFRSRFEALLDGLLGEAADRFYFWQANTKRMVKGVHQAMQGRASRARRLMTAFGKETAAPRSYYALHYFGHALVLEAEGAPDDEVNFWLEEAYETWPSSRRIRQKIGQKTGVEPPDEEEPYPRPFPLSYALVEGDPLTDPVVKDPVLVGLNAELSKLREDQFLVVVLLSGYRTNGYYARLANQLAAMRPLLGDYFPQVHVITAFRPGDGTGNLWIDGEELALERGVPLRVLLDPENLTSAIVDADGSPCGLIVNRSGVILYQGSLQGERGYWLAMRSLDTRNLSESNEA